MQTVSLFNAKTHLSRIVDDLLTGKEDAIVISRHGKPAVRMLPCDRTEVVKRIGVARGRFDVPDDIDSLNPDIEQLFHGKKGL